MGSSLSSIALALLFDTECIHAFSVRRSASVRACMHLLGYCSSWRATKSAWGVKWWVGPGAFATSSISLFFEFGVVVERRVHRWRLYWIIWPVYVTFLPLFCSVSCISTKCDGFSCRRALPSWALSAWAVPNGAAKSSLSYKDISSQYRRQKYLLIITITCLYPHYYCGLYSWIVVVRYIENALCCSSPRKNRSFLFVHRFGRHAGK